MSTEKKKARDIRKAGNDISSPDKRKAGKPAGSPKTGGRKKGTPNKENPLKGYLRAHSLAYFEPKPQIAADGSPRKLGDEFVLADEDGNALVMSDFDVDMMCLDTDDRVMAELRLLKFHTPEMKSVDVDMTIGETSLTIEDRLRELCAETDSDS